SLSPPPSPSPSSSTPPLPSAPFHIKQDQLSSLSTSSMSILESTISGQNSKAKTPPFTTITTTTNETTGSSSSSSTETLEKDSLSNNQSLYSSINFPSSYRIPILPSDII